MESEFIAWLRQNLPPHPQLRLGIGDDAALLALSRSKDCLVTTDLLTDGVHFKLADTDPQAVGRKALAVNLSDIAAMAGRPLAAFVALALPRRGGKELAISLYGGMLPLAQQFGVAIAGGDTNSWDGPLVISVTVVGEPGAQCVWTRSGARPGDRIVVTGELGGSILGRHLQFQPRITEALHLAERYEVHAAVDISDGLSLDLSHVADESGCGALVNLQRVPIADAAHELVSMHKDDRSALERALGDGEDFELLMAVPPAEAERMLAEQPLAVTLTEIGEFVGEPGLWHLDPDGSRHRLEAQGFEH